ncbi:helix-hairpin-helix domain-containing protein [Aliikangiella sp. G2MR2-5]|uniref:ComEA family DNA-binding protein n=1 Tax=Aliikangiella sp. G2MR2-5 TaxID=2788943 RepID=UPI0018A8DFA2|nr:helix-hairpin-helix domain-containing protein [Aliikangiella sp. G2MR2-5]
MKKFAILLLSFTLFGGFNQMLMAKTEVVKPASKVVKVKDIKHTTKVNLNSAGAKEIAEALTGVGMKKASAIVEFRKLNGKFKKVEDLAAVKGIGVATIAKNESRILLN